MTNTPSPREVFDVHAAQANLDGLSEEHVATLRRRAVPEPLADVVTQEVADIIGDVANGAAAG